MKRSTHKVVVHTSVQTISFPQLFSWMAAYVPAAAATNQLLLEKVSVNAPPRQVCPATVTHGFDGHAANKIGRAHV